MELQRSRDSHIEISVRDCHDRLFAYRNASAPARPSPYPPPACLAERREPPAAPALVRMVAPVDGIDPSEVADALEQPIAEFQDRYAREVSEFVKESEMHRHDVNRKERQG